MASDTTLTADRLRTLVGPQPGAPVLSVHLRTDPRDPANTNHVPAWAIALRNGLRDVGRRLEISGTRDERLGFRDLAARVEAELLGATGEQRARGVSWFASADGKVDRRFALQIPPRDHVVRWDAEPFISPLVEVAARGRPTALVLVGRAAVRLLRWHHGIVDEPADSVYELRLGDWREYAAYAAANPARGQQTATNVEAYEDRVDVWRARLYRDSAVAVAQRLPELGLGRVVVAGEAHLAQELVEELPPPVARKVAAVVDSNLLGEEPPVVAEHLEEALEEAWRCEGENLLDDALEAAAAGGRATVGLDETFGALVARRVEHLVLDPAHPFDSATLGPATHEAAGAPTDGMLGERAVELAVSSAVEVTVLDAGHTATLASVGGMVATLRY